MKRSVVPQYPYQPYPPQYVPLQSYQSSAHHPFTSNDIIIEEVLIPDAKSRHLPISTALKVLYDENAGNSWPASGGYNPAFSAYPPPAPGKKDRRREQHLIDSIFTDMRTYFGHSNIQQTSPETAYLQEKVDNLERKLTENDELIRKLNMQDRDKERELERLRQQAKYSRNTGPPSRNSYQSSRSKAPSFEPYFKSRHSSKSEKSHQKSQYSDRPSLGKVASKSRQSGSYRSRGSVNMPSKTIESGVQENF